MPYLVHADRWLPVEAPLILGRGADCQVRIGDDGLSRHHARVYPDQGGWWVEDLGSANGTMLNGRALITGPARLGDGDRIALGSASLGFRLQKPAAATPPAAADPMALIGRELGGHRLESFLGPSVTGALYKARHLRDEREVALKVVDRRLTTGDAAAFITRFQGDITIAAGIHHPSLMRIHRCAVTDGLLWYSMELVSGQTVAQLVHGTITPLAALRLALGAAEVLAVFHDAGLVHGDVKPASLLIDAHNHLRLLDIGLIGLHPDEIRLLQADGATRQVYYLCPAQARGGACSARGDIYSVGCLLVHLLTGLPPFRGKDFADTVAAHEREPIPQLADQLGLPAKLDEVLGFLLHKDPFFRYESMRFAVDALRTVLTQADKRAAAH